MLTVIQLTSTEKKESVRHEHRAVSLRQSSVG